MNSLNKLMRKAGAACLATLWCTSPVWGDDTEIFFGDIGSASAKPNVLFIIDTSGSMGGLVVDTGKDRLDNVKDAMYELLGELNNVNVGLMRFTNPGGPVLFPVRYIDEDVNAGSIVTVEGSIQRGSDDAQELKDSGQVFLDESRLEIIESTSIGLLQFEDRVATGEDDSEEYISNGNSFNTSNVLDMDSNRRIGVRFTGSDVPDGAIITNAYLRFTATNSDADPISMLISGQRDDTTSFSNGTNDLRNRADTTASVNWTIPSTVASGQTVDSPNIAAIVQEIVDNPVWDPAGGGEDDMVFIIEAVSGNGEKDFHSRNAGSTQAPELFVEYYVGVAPAVEETIVGMRFDEISIPRGVTVTEAHVIFTAERDFSTTFELEIDLEKDDSVTFTDTPKDISDRNLTGKEVDWVGSMSLSAGDTFQTPDLSDLVAELTDSNNWCGGEAMTVIIEGKSGRMPVWAFEGNASLAPRLVVNYEYDSIPQGSSCVRRTINRQVSGSQDDAEETGSSATTSSTDLDLYAGSDVGLRFPDMPIPKDAEIFSARLQLVSDAYDSGTTEMKISAENTGDAQPFTGTNGTIDDRSYHGGGEDWNATSPWDTNDVVNSPDISKLIEDIVGDSDWETGNAMGFRIETTTSTNRRAESYDGNPDEAPRLIVEYQDDGTGLVDRKVRDVMTDLVSQLNHNGWTPVQDTLYEAARYYTDMPVLWGATRGQSDVDGGPFSYARVSAAESMVDGSYSINRPAGCSGSNLDDSDCRFETISGVGGNALYDSPIDDFCQEQSHIIMLTDGEANRPHSEDLIEDFIGGSCANEATLLPGGLTQALTSGERCVKDLARYMNENDMRPTLNGNQRITTHTIGFNFSSQWLEDVATAGGGQYKTANNAAELADQIRDIIGEVLKTDSTFVAPVAAVNQFNQLSHLAQVYFAVFRPDEFPRWRGNLKKYTLSEEGGNIVDANGNLAIDPDTGFFNGVARSFWSSTADGATVDIGGAAENVPAYASRNVYTYYDGSSSTNLANSVNALDSSNGNLTQAMFDTPSYTAGEFADHIEWVRGRDVDDEDEDGNTTEDRYVFGDPLHSRPVAITYGGTETNPDVEVFLGTNSGAIQSVDATTGAETFAFYPEAMLPLQNDLRQNLSGTDHPYGIDGTITPWFNDNGRDGIDPTDPLDYVRIYTGMRRGGRNYYALDVTDRGAPEVMWEIQGGTVHGNGDDFRELGQTWSRPIKTRIALSGDTVPRDVLIFSAGYDEVQDDAQLRTADNVGRGMYMVDALTGRLIWSGGLTGAQAWTESFSDMDYSFPSTMSVVDINQDGLADMWFGADTGGRLWRFDIRNGESLANLVTGGVIADLGVNGGTNSIQANRRFFASPSVALVRGPDGPELAVAIGSGFRPSPLSILAQNRMFLIRQLAVFSPPSSYTAVTESDLYDATANTLATATGTALTAEQELLYESQGWYFDMQLSGEKVLSSPLIANERVIFTTYTPGDSGVWCRPAAGQSRAYSVRLEDAVRTEPRPLLTPSIVDQATIIVPPPYVPDPNEPEDPNEPDDPNDPPDACPNGNSVVIKLNAEDGPVDDWCNDASKTYWVKEQ